MQLTKRESKHRSQQLNALLCEWDPLGVMDDPSCPRDEYECLVGPLLTQLQADVNEQVLTGLLVRELIDHFELSSDSARVATVASRLKRWYDLAWRDTGEVETVYVALVNEGVDVWRPVQARRLRDDAFRLIGVEGDACDETWRYPVGAIVRCEPKEFADGQIGLVATEQVASAG